MEEERSPSCYDGNAVDLFHFYLSETKEHEFCLRFLQDVLPSHFKRVAAGRSNLDVLGVGSGEGGMDVGLLLMLQAEAPGASITAEVVEGSAALTQTFKALVANSRELQQVPFTWHVMCHEDYERQVKAQNKVKKFDFIHMIEMIYFLDNLTTAISFYHSLLKENGRLMIILDAHDSGMDTLWTTYKNELSSSNCMKNYTGSDVISCVESLGLEYEECVIPFNIDITECFHPDSQCGERLLSTLTETDHFYQSFTPEVREGMLDLLLNKCSTQKDGKILLNNNLSCILICA